MSVPAGKRVQRYLAVMVRWVVIVTVVFVLTVFAVSYITNNLLSKSYSASTVLEVPASDLDTPTAGSAMEPVAYRPEFENIILSPGFLLSVVKNLGLDKAWALQTKSSQDELSDADALAHLEKLVKIDVQPGTNLVRITVASDVPTETSAIANAIADRYVALREIAGGSEYRLNPPLFGEKPVRIVTRAEPPQGPSQADKDFNFFGSLAIAAVLSLLTASFVEMALLFVRAGERTDN